MDSRSCITPWDLECMLCVETTAPKALPLSLLKEITGDFSNEHEIGSGGFAVVYKGMLENKIVAVKRMSNTYMHEKEFHREVECLMMVKHKNVVRFLGYCADTQGSMERYNGKYVMADVQQRLLCFEYLPNGSLHDYITDESSGLKWRDRFHIIKGIFQGLCYLHQKHIVHLDLKPANILLGENLVAKITDFGLSRCFDEMQSQAITMNTFGTFGYLAPEFGNDEVTYKLDIYGLGVIIIEMLTGKKGYHDVDKVVESWSNKLEISQLEQVRVCAEIGMECTNFNPAKRPDTQHIISKLHETDSVDGYIQTGMITLQLEEDAPNELHQDTPIAPGEIMSDGLQKNTRGEIMSLKNELWSIEAALISVSETPLNQSPDKQVKLWALEIKGLSYEIDCVERYLVHLQSQQQEKPDRSGFIPFMVTKDEIQHKIDSDIKGIKERVIRLGCLVKRYLYVQ